MIRYNVKITKTRFSQKCVPVPYGISSFDCTILEVTG